MKKGAHEGTTFRQWPKELRIKRGLLNGERVKMAREARGLERYALARKIGMQAAELELREADWCFWTEYEQAGLLDILNFPIAFFVQDDPPIITPFFMCGHDEEGEHWCEYVEKESK